MNVNSKLSGLYSSLFVIRFSLIFQKKNLVVGGGGNRKEPVFSVPLPAQKQFRLPRDLSPLHAEEHHVEEFTSNSMPNGIRIEVKY